MAGVTDSLPLRLLTDRGGVSQRLRVDPGQTGFFAGRMFRSFVSQTLPVAGPSVSFRFVAPVDFILWSQDLTLTQGALQLEIFTGVTDGGGWVTELPIIGVNRMSERPQPFYNPQVTIQTGGSFTGGTRVDLIIVNSGSNQGNQSSQNAGGQTTERGLPAGSYFGRFSTLVGGIVPLDAALFLYALAWEERVP